MRPYSSDSFTPFRLVTYICNLLLFKRPYLSLSFTLLTIRLWLNNTWQVLIWVCPHLAYLSPLYSAMYAYRDRLRSASNVTSEVFMLFLAWHFVKKDFKDSAEQYNHTDDTCTSNKVRSNNPELILVDECKSATESSQSETATDSSQTLLWDIVNCITQNVHIWR